VFPDGNLRKKTTFLLTVCIMILVVVFLGFYVFNNLYQQTTPVKEIIHDPSSWVNKTVTVEGILANVPQPNPTYYGLFPENQTVFLNVQWNSSNVLIPQYNATTAIVHGVIREEEWTPQTSQIPLEKKSTTLKPKTLNSVNPRLKTTLKNLSQSS